MPETPEETTASNAITGDTHTTVSALRQLVHQFVAERNWQQFHSPKNLAMALSIEAAELMEHFQWCTGEESRELTKNPAKLAEVGEELADVLSYSLGLANTLGIDLTQALQSKMQKNRVKYPADTYRGRYKREPEVRE